MQDHLVPSQPRQLGRSADKDFENRRHSPPAHLRKEWVQAGWWVRVREENCLKVYTRFPYIASHCDPQNMQDRY